MEITAQMIKELRAQTGAGVMDVKAALQAADGDQEKAIEELRKKGAAKAAKKAERAANEGWIGSYIHATGKLAGLVALQCETDFVARNEEFQTLAHHIAMQVVATDPQYLAPEDVPEEVIAKETEIVTEQLKGEGKDEAVIEKIIPGKLEKFYSENCLLKQPFFKEDEKTVEEMINEAVIKLGENIKIGNFTRFSL